MNKYFLKIQGENNNTASIKAKVDIENILSKSGYEVFKEKKWSFLKDCFNLLLKSDESIIVIQYPFISKTKFEILRKLKLLKKIKLITIIHDINSLRDIGVNKTEEISILNLSDYLIAHNNAMKNWLIDNGITKTINNIEIFDYLKNIESDKNNSNKNNDDFKKIYFAGNLDKKKSGFLYSNDMKTINIKFNLYGPNFDLNNTNKNLKYYGVFKPEELINHFGEGFGLIWDGSSIEECNGLSGEYLKYNNPHKTSLYLVSGLPVIIWEKAAMAKFIKENDLGIVISSLSNLDEVLNGITYDRYLEIKNNVNLIKSKIENGFFTKESINKTIKEFK
ncbi:hypothetical protein P7A61_11155 [Clostridium perfringens]|nr:hypothetical protein [Clostridium perfringens]